MTQDDPTQPSLSGMFQNYYLDYASYVILERAVPSAVDGLKPVQRRILHSLNEMDDGRLNKVANVIGHCMRYHPHGDASIGEALVNLGQKPLIIDAQGNWGNIYTGDAAAAARYIEARLSAFAKDVLFNDDITEWTRSYDGRSEEPVHLPIKFPLLLMLGTEGIAVGLSTRILPHNFNELADACIASLRNEDVTIYPDFPTGGLMDVADYRDGKRGGRIRVRANILKKDAKTLVIDEIPAGTNTNALIESILAAIDKGKVKIKRIDNNTAKKVEIVLHLATGADPQQTIEALYAFTGCEDSLSPNCCVIDSGKPIFIGVSELLKRNASRTRDLLKAELELRRHQLMEKIFFGTLEQIFIEKKIYRDIEECESWEAVITTIHRRLSKYKSQLARPITDDDVVALTEIKIKKISKFDLDKSNEALARIREELAEVEKDLAQLTRYAINFFKNLKKQYGSGLQRMTRITNFQAVNKVEVAANNVKLYANLKDGFVGWGLKKESLISECSDLDEIICINSAGQMSVTKITEKSFTMKDLIHVAVFRRGDEDRTYNMVFRDPERGALLVKRFHVPSITRDRVYDLTNGVDKAKVIYLSVSETPAQAEKIRLKLKPNPKLSYSELEFDFSELPVKGRDQSGNVLTKLAVTKVELAPEPE
jgi:topoisomerase-4 subunit A